MKKGLSINIIFSLLLQMVAIINSFITTKITISFFGSEINGLISSVNQFLNYVSLLEGGVGAVVMAALYQPLYNNDTNRVSEIINASKKFFRQLIGIYLIYTFFLSFIYPLIIGITISKKTVIILIWILSVSLCSQYFFAISYKILLQADHKLYVCSLIQIIAYIINVFLMIFVSYKFRNILIVKFFSSLSFLLQPLLYTLIVNKKYKIYTSKKSNTYNLKGRWDGFFQNLAFFINNNTDIVLITLMLNLNEVSVYSVYMLVINGMKSVILSISTGFQSFLGREIASKDVKKLNSFMKKYITIIIILSLIGFGTVIILVRQFVSVYVGNGVDYEYDRYLFPLIIAFSQMIICIREPLNLLIISANKFKETNKGAAIEAILNIIISCLLIKKYGLIGISVGTLIASIYRLLYFIIYLHNNIIFIKYKKLVKPAILLFCWTVIICIYYFKLDKLFCKDWLSFISYGILYTIINSLFVIILSLIIWQINPIVFIHNKKIKRYN